MCRLQIAVRTLSFVLECDRKNAIWCLRKKLRIMPPFYIRISNAAVFPRAHSICFSRCLLREQLLYLGKVARRPDEDVIRALIFRPSGLEIKESDGVRKRGRPKTNSISHIKESSLELFPRRTCQTFIMCKAKWRAVVCKHCKVS